MTTHIEAIPMDVDRDQSPSSGSDTSQVSFVDEYESLPASGPSSHAHIIDLGDYVEKAKEDGMVKLQDAIVTTLFCTSAETLKNFLSPTVNTFKGIFGKKGIQLVIWRKGLEVFIGTYESYPTPKIFKFDHVAGFLIGYDGAWHLKATAGGACSNPKWPEIWAGKFELYPLVSEMVVETEEMAMAKRVDPCGVNALSALLGAQRRRQNDLNGIVEDLERQPGMESKDRCF